MSTVRETLLEMDIEKLQNELDVAQRWKREAEMNEAVAVSLKEELSRANAVIDISEGHRNNERAERLQQRDQLRRLFTEHAKVVLERDKLKDSLVEIGRALFQSVGAELKAGRDLECFRRYADKMRLGYVKMQSNYKQAVDDLQVTAGDLIRIKYILSVVVSSSSQPCPVCEAPEGEDCWPGCGVVEAMDD